MPRYSKQQDAALLARLQAYQKAGYAYAEEVLPRIYVLKKSERSLRGLVLGQYPKMHATWVCDLKDFI